MTPTIHFSQHLRHAARNLLLAAAIALSAIGATSAIAADGNASARRQNVVEGEFANFLQWQGVSAFIDQLVARDGFSRPELEAILRQTQYVDSAIQLIKPAPPGRPKNWQAYRARFVEQVRINAGVAFWNRHAEALARAEARFGVPAEIIIGIIGVETVYGRNTGNFRVMDAITTLAFAYPDTPNREARMAYFRKELENTLLFARESGIDPFSLLGSYAGAIGWAQFMPGSIRQFAVDYDGDHKIDLRNSPVDAIGSVANFLVQHGWKSGEPIVFPATISTASPPAGAVMLAAPGGTSGGGALPVAATNTVTNPAWQQFIAQSLEANYTPEELAAGGILPVTPLPSNMRFGLVDLQNGTEPAEYWLGANNFFAITQYNRSFFYAMSVVDLGRAVRVARSRVQ